MKVMGLMLANAAPDPMIPWSLLTAFILAAIPILGAVWLKARAVGVKSANEGRDVTLKDPMPEMPVKRVYSPPSFSQHMNVVDRVVKLEKEADELREAFHKESAAIRRDLSKQYVEILHAGHERENRISDKLDDIARAFHSRVDELVKFNPMNK